MTKEPDKPQHEEQKRKPSLTSRIRNTIFHHGHDQQPTNPEPNPDPTVSHPFLLPPPPSWPNPKPSPSAKPTSKTAPKFTSNPKPRRTRHESADEYSLRKARLELASKLQTQSPKSPLLDRLDPKTGRVVEPGLAGTARERNQKNRRVRRKKGLVDGNDIRENWEGEGSGGSE